MVGTENDIYVPNAVFAIVLVRQTGHCLHNICKPDPNLAIHNLDALRKIKYYFRG
jgi:hypothetical protein